MSQKLKLLTLTTYVSTIIVPIFGLICYSIAVGVVIELRRNNFRFLRPGMQLPHIQYLFIGKSLCSTISSEESTSESSNTISLVTTAIKLFS